MADKILDTVLLLALPASGKSEVRKYLRSLSPDECQRDFHMGPTTQLDDFPYVHVMRRIDDEVAKHMRGKRLFFKAADSSFRDPLDWGTLIQLVNEDHADLVSRRRHDPESAAEWLVSRVDEAGKKVGAPSRLKELEDGVRAKVIEALEKEARELLDEKHANYPDKLTGRTMVIEFARGRKDGSSMPLSDPFGYQYSLAQLSDAILSKAVILYVWVEPKESRRKNEARNDPNDPGSILHHSVPLEVMLGDYGCDDMDWLEENAKKPGTVAVETRGKIFHLPVARFDNRVDKTSFIRDDKKDWKPEDVKAVHEGLKGALDRLAASPFAVIS